MNPVSFHDIPQTVLAALLDHEGQAAAMSPRTLMGKASQVTKHQLAELYAGGFVEMPTNSAVIPTPAFGEVLRILLDPNTNITFRNWGKDNMCGETSLLLPADLFDGGGVVLNQVDENYRITSPVEISDILTLICPVIPVEAAQGNKFTFEGHFDVPVAAVLFGLIDLVRQNNESTFMDSQIYGYLNGLWGLTGFDCLISYIATAGMMPCPPSLKVVEFALQILLDANIINDNAENGYSLADSVNPMLALIPETIPGLQWQRVSQTKGEDLLCCNRIFLMCNEGFILSFSTTVKGKIFIAIVTRDDLINFLLDEFMLNFPRLGVNITENVEGNSTVFVREPQASHTKLNCASCGKSLLAKNKFCTHCGAKVI